jgi:SAM-dependent methyltransferase
MVPTSALIEQPQAVPNADSPLFSHLESTYNLLPALPRDRFFVELVLDVIRTRPGARTVVDIGCGRGIGTDPLLLERIRAESDCLVGVEPDPHVEPAHGAFDALHRSTFEESGIPDGSVDVAFSCMVMEHVLDPDGFMDRLQRALRPGGSYIFMTVNGAHYFARIANALRRAGLDEFVLRAVRGSEAVDGYHYPTAYRFNDPAAIARACGRAGLLPPRFVFAEHEGARCYFPRPARAAWHALTLKRRIVRRPELLLELIGMVTKP